MDASKEALFLKVCVCGQFSQFKTIKKPSRLKLWNTSKPTNIL